MERTCPTESIVAARICVPPTSIPMVNIRSKVKVQSSKKSREGAVMLNTIEHLDRAKRPFAALRVTGFHDEASQRRWGMTFLRNAARELLWASMIGRPRLSVRSNSEL